MTVTFLGTGTSMGVPVAGGQSLSRRTGDSRDDRWRCSAWIQTEQTSVVIDTGPEFRLQSLRSGVDRIDLVLITHEHMDHIAGLDDLRPYCMRQNQTLPVYTTEAAVEAIHSRFDSMFGPDRYRGATSVDLHILREPVTFNDLQITPLPVRHGAVDVMGFRINDFSYLTDVKEIPAETMERIRGSEVMVLSGLRWEPDHPTHLTIPQALDIVDKLEVPQTYLIHMNGQVAHAETEERLPDHVQLAYDRLTLTVGE